MDPVNDGEEEFDEEGVQYSTKHDNKIFSFLEKRETKSAETSPVVKRKTERFMSTVQAPPGLTKSRKISYKDETMMFRDHNLFSKKVPKDAEAVNIQVATCDFLSKPFLAFVRLQTPIVLDDFSEINKPTR